MAYRLDIVIKLTLGKVGMEGNLQVIQTQVMQAQVMQASLVLHIDN